MSGQGPPLTEDEMDRLCAVQKELYDLDKLTMKDIAWLPVREEWDIKTGENGEVIKEQKQPVTMLVEGEVEYMGMVWEVGIIGAARMRRFVRDVKDEVVQIDIINQ